MPYWFWTSRAAYTPVCLSFDKIRMRIQFLIICSIWTSSMLAQQTEYSIQLQSGLFSFRGKDAAKVTSISVNDVSGYPNMTWKYYGKNPGFSYSIEAGIKRITRRKCLYGLGLAFESLQSKVDINNVFYFGGSEEASGKTRLTSQFINFNPYFGKRIMTKRVMLDFTAGLDLGVCMKSHEKGYAMTITGNYLTTDNEVQKPPLDIRARIQLTAYCKRFGFLLGYSLGMTNYYGHRNGGDPEAYSRFLRSGISYRLK